jgi:hypothetical protein
MNVIISKISLRAKICFVACDICRVIECCSIREHGDLLTPTVIHKVVFDPIISGTHIELNAKQRLEYLLQMWIPCPGPTQSFILFGTESSLQEVERRRRKADHSLPFSPEVKNEKLYLTSIMCFHDVYGDNFSLHF